MEMNHGNKQFFLLGTILVTMLVTSVFWMAYIHLSGNNDTMKAGNPSFRNLETVAEKKTEEAVPNTDKDPHSMDLLDSLKKENWKNREQIEQLIVENLRLAAKASVSESGQAKYTYDMFREAMEKKLAGKNIDDPELDQILQGSLSDSRLEEILSKGGRTPATLVAAASITMNPDSAIKYLEEAAEKNPDSPQILAALVTKLINEKRLDAKTAGWIADLKRTDPSNAYSDYCLAAYCMETGNIQGAVDALNQAASKNYCQDYKLTTVMERAHFFQDAGCSSGLAYFQGTMGLPVENMSQMRELSRTCIVESENQMNLGKTEDALKLVESVENMGRNISAGSRLLIHDLVGIAVRKTALEKSAEICRKQGMTEKWEESQKSLADLEQRKQRIREAIQAVPDEQYMDDETLFDYIENILIKGELETLLLQKNHSR